MRVFVAICRASSSVFWKSRSAQSKLVWATLFLRFVVEKNIITFVNSTFRRILPFLSYIDHFASDPILVQNYDLYQISDQNYQLSAFTIENYNIYFGLARLPRLCLHLRRCHSVRPTTFVRLKWQKFKNQWTFSINSGLSYHPIVVQVT